MLFGERLRNERKKNNLSAQTLSELCGVARSYITLIENGKRLPGKKVIPKIAQALNINRTNVVNWYLEDLKQKLL